MLSVEDYYFYSYYDTSKSTIGSHITQLLISILRLWVIYLLCPVEEIKYSNYYNLLAAYKISESASFHRVVLIYCFGTQCYNELSCFTYFNVKESSAR